jgi:hypothetical protein
MSKCECKSQEQNKETLQSKLIEFEKLKGQVSYLAGQIALLQELVTCKCDGDCECQTG